MAEAYLLLKWLHIIFAILAVGFNASYAIILQRAHAEPDHLGHALATVHFMDSKVATPGYVLLLVTGLAMAQLAPWPLTTFWLSAALGIYGLIALIAVVGYAPLLRKTREALAEAGPRDPGVAHLLRRGNIMGGFLLVAVGIIVYLMVVKPVAPW